MFLRGILFSIIFEIADCSGKSLVWLPDDTRTFLYVFIGLPLTSSIYLQKIKIWLQTHTSSSKMDL